MGGLLPPPPTNAARPLNPPGGSSEDWGDFESFGSDPKAQSSASGNSGGWVQF